MTWQEHAVILNHGSQRNMVEYIANEHVMSGISLLCTEFNVRSKKCFLKRCKWSENNIFRSSKDLFLKFVEKL